MATFRTFFLVFVTLGVFTLVSLAWLSLINDHIKANTDDNNTGPAPDVIPIYGPGSSNDTTTDEDESDNRGNPASKELRPYDEPESTVYGLNKYNASTTNNSTIVSYDELVSKNNNSAVTSSQSNDTTSASGEKTCKKNETAITTSETNTTLASPPVVETQTTKFNLRGSSFNNKDELMPLRRRGDEDTQELEEENHHEDSELQVVQARRRLVGETKDGEGEKKVGGEDENKAAENKDEKNVGEANEVKVKVYVDDKGEKKVGEVKVEDDPMLMLYSVLIVIVPLVLLIVLLSTVGMMLFRWKEEKAHEARIDAIIAERQKGRDNTFTLPPLAEKKKQAGPDYYAEDKKRWSWKSVL